MLRHRSSGYVCFTVQEISEERFVVSKETTYDVVIWIVEGKLDKFRFVHHWMIAAAGTLLAISCTLILHLY